MKRIAFSALVSLLAAGAAAEPVKCVDASGKIRYLDSTLISTEKCEAVKESTNVVAPQAAPPARKQAPRSSEARPDAELARAQERLAQAQKDLADQEAIRNGNERNYARVLERLKPYQDAVESAQREVDQLRRDSR
jgi:hypothetical protein